MQVTVTILNLLPIHDTVCLQLAMFSCVGCGAENPEDIGEAVLLKDKVQTSVRKLKSGKAAGVDEICGKLLKYGGNDVVDAIFTICQHIWWQSEQLPQV